MRGVSELAQQLLADACQGSDPPLILALPHTRQLSLYSSQGAMAHRAVTIPAWPACTGGMWTIWQRVQR